MSNVIIIATLRSVLLWRAARHREMVNVHPDKISPGFQLMFNSGGASGFFDVGNGTVEGRASWSQQLIAGTWWRPSMSLCRMAFNSPEH
jgi:hypothetical protein